MRLVSTADLKVLSKLPQKMEWLSEKIEKLAFGCNNGYAKLQSSRISRGRLTMTDISDERATTAWSEQIWTEKDGAREWPAVLRPQRPEQITLNRCGQSQRRNKRRIQPATSEIDIFENPPVFLTIKDIKTRRFEENSESMSRTSTPRRIKRNEVVGGLSKNSPTWPAALLTVLDTMSEDIELLGMELAREYHFCQEELVKKKEQVIELSKKEIGYLRSIEDLRSELKKTKNEVKEVKAQLLIRSEATQRLEQENSTMRDDIARMRVQVETNIVEKETLLQRWETAESERVILKGKCGELEDIVLENTTFKEQCLMLQNQLRNTVAKIVSQQEMAQKEFGKVDRAAEDAISFSKTVWNHLQRHETQSKELDKLIKESENKFLALSVELSKIRRERDQYKSEKQSEANQSDARYYEEWQKYQENNKKRIDGFIYENQRLMEELDLIREQNNSESIDLKLLQE